MMGQFLIWISMYIVVVCGADLAPRLKSSIVSERIAFVNDSVELMCKFRKPRPYVIWRYNGELIKYTKRVHIGRNVLKIRRVRLSDAGTYNCVGTNDYGSTWGNFTLVVFENPEAYDYQAGEKDWTKTGPCDTDPLKGKPMWTKQKGDTKALAKPAGHDIEIDCDARGHPRPNITWYKNNKEIQFGEDGKYTKDGWKIKISELTLQDQANYTCVVQNECGAIRWTYSLEVVHRMMVAPMIADIANQTVMKGEDVVFRCEILFSDSQPFLQWLRHYKVNGSYVDENDEPYVHKLKQSGQLKTIDDPKYLKITNVTEEDMGWYTCLVANSIGMNYRTAWLTVLNDDRTKTSTCDSDPLKVKPIWTKMRDETKLLAKPAGHDIEIDCDARGHPRPNITWYKNNEEIQIGEDGKYTKDGWKIKISDLTLQDQANYTCVVQNECGTIRWTYGLEVVQRLMVAPMIADIANQTVMKGEDVVFTCKILDSDSQPFLQWLRLYKVNGSYVDENNEPYVHKLQQSRQLKTIDDPQYLMITNVTEEDMGWYTCLVTNSVGMNYRSAWLTVLLNYAEYEVTVHFGSDIYAGEIGGTLTLTLTDSDGQYQVILSISGRLRPNAKITKEIKAVNIPQLSSLDLQITGYMMPAVQIKTIHLTVNKNNDGKEYIFTDIGWVNPIKTINPDPGCQATSTVMDILVPNTRYLTYDKLRSEDVRCRDGYRQKASEVTCLKTGKWSDQLCAIPRPKLIRGILITSSSTYSTWAAQRAVDGNSNRAPYWCHCCASTTRQYEPWYKVDLGRLYEVYRLTVLGRGGFGDIGGGNRQTFKNMRISYGQTHYNEEVLVSNYGDVYVYNETFVEPKLARFLQLTLVGQKPQYFVICELLVYGYK